MRTPRIPAFIVVIVLAVAACSNAASPTTPPAAAPSTEAAPSTGVAPSTGTAPSTGIVPSLPAASAASSSNAVSIKDIAFNPATITVKAGDKVTWTNNDGLAHTVTLDDNSVDSGILTPGATFNNTFTAAGTFAYHCKIHPPMHGTVTVT
jgi:plastocyanin